MHSTTEHIIYHSTLYYQQSNKVNKKNIKKLKNYSTLFRRQKSPNYRFLVYFQLLIAVFGLICVPKCAFFAKNQVIFPFFDEKPFRILF